jgi:hypothetical protein
LDVDDDTRVDVESDGDLSALMSSATATPVEVERSVGVDGDSGVEPLSASMSSATATPTKSSALSASVTPTTTSSARRR